MSGTILGNKVHSEDDTQWLTTGEQRSWRAYILGTELLLHQLDHELREEHDLSFSEYEILVRLSEAEGGRMRMSTLAESMCHSRSRTTHTVARMEKAGLVVREASPGDARGVEAVMTRAGQERIDAAAPTPVRGVRSHLVDLASVEEFKLIGQVFDAVSDRLATGRLSGDADIRSALSN
jgi:DNA-binding MarR family transcriptional regulator